METRQTKSGCEISRRRFVATTAALGAASLLGISPRAAADPPPETIRIRLI